MSESLKTLLNTVGSHVARNIIQSHIVYPKTENLSDKAILETEFENSLNDAITFIEKSINLKAIDAIKDAFEVLCMMEEFKESIMIDQADYIVIYKGGFNIIKLKNSLNPASGRSIYVEINSCRNELIRYIQTVQGRTIDWVGVGTAFGVGVIACAVVFREFLKK